MPARIGGHGRVVPDLSCLAPVDRAAVLLAARPGETYRTVAAVLGEPEDVTRRRIRLALQRLAGGPRPPVAT